jgi:uncharacterized membrane protein YgdD (TMEM256/DUF423 family)
MRQGRIWIAVAGFFGLTGVALGAVAAHAVQDPHAAAMLQRAAQYQLLHAAALLALSLGGAGAAGLHKGLCRAAQAAFALGMAGFSGGIVLHYLAGMPAAAHLAPLGGCCLMAGWAALILSPFLRPEPIQRS